MRPALHRDASRLMLLDRRAGVVGHQAFRDLPLLLRPSSLLVLNDTRVLRARLFARKNTGGVVQLLLTQPEYQWPTMVTSGPGETRRVFAWEETWQVLATGLKKLPPGSVVQVAPWLDAVLIERLDRGAAIFNFRCHEPDAAKSLVQAAEQLGQIPLPPYIEAARRKERGIQGSGNVTDEADLERYQTVFATQPGAVAAPTAGLHFTPALLEEIQDRGHQIARVTLHVGPGTFRPVKVDDPRAHKMDAERYEIPAASQVLIDQARAEGRPIVAVGTTVVRTLESAFRAGFPPGQQSTELFLMPGSNFEVVTDLVTNFHLPKSTLLMLVAAFAGKDNVMEAYREAVAQNYRFYSYGDAMFLSPQLACRVAPNEDHAR